jgi:outer membrane receptor protein involved in Fe transport
MSRHLVVTACLLLFARPGFCQQRIHGAVMDAESHEPLVGVTVRDEKGSAGAVSSTNGTFSLTTSGQGSDSLDVTYTGYKPLRVAAAPVLTISLHPQPAALNELVVTASRQAEQRTQAPVALGVISSAMLRQTRPVTLDQVLNKVSGVYMVDLGNEQHTMAIRQPIGYRSNFLYLEDGIPIRTIGDFNHNALIEINQADTRRIEVIKGPSSALYGSDAVGGAVNFITKAPALIPDARVSVEASSEGYRRADLTASNTFGRTGLLLSGYYARQQGGYIQHGDFHKTALTARLDRQLGDKQHLTAAVTWIDYYTDQHGGLDSAHFFGKDYRSFYTFTDRQVKALRARVSWQRQREGGGSTATLYYRNNSVGQNPFYRIKNGADPGKASGEINNNYFQSFGLLARHSWRLDKWDTRIMAAVNAEISPAGYRANYTDITRNEAGYYTGYTETDSLLSHYRVDMYTTAAFLRVQTSPVPRLRLVAGLRYDRLDYDFNNYLPPSAYTGAPDGSSHFRQLTPKAGLTWDFGKDRGAYANYSIGFAPPDISDLYEGVKIPYLKPARYFNEEVGGWISFSDQKGYADLSLYRMNGVHEIISVRQPDGSFLNRNTGRTLHYGVEYTLRYRPVPAWEIRVSGTNARHRFIDYVDRGHDYRGDEMSGAPHWIVNSQLTYRPASLKGLEVAAEWQHLSSYFMDPANTMRYGGYDLFNVSVNYSLKQFSFWLHLVNAANTVYATSAEKSAYAVTYYPGPLRTLYAGFDYHFGKKKKK